MSEKVCKFIKYEDNVPIDERMEPETKHYVKNALKLFGPDKVIKTDMKIFRKMKDEASIKLKETFNFVNLTIKDTFVLNSNDDYKIPIRIFTPKDARTSAPITVFFHGGGWTLCSIETHHHCVASLASNSKTIWISVEYRLAPEYQFDTQISDCKQVLEYVLKNRAEFGATSGCKVGVCGDSAGGNYSAIIAHEYKTQIDYQILVYPCVDLGNTYESNKEFSHEAYYLTPDLILFFIKNLLGENNLDLVKSDRISPILKSDFSNLPKCLIVLAQLDPLVDQNIAYQKKLLENGNSCDLITIMSTIHGFFNNGFILKDAFNQAQDRILKFLDKIN